LTTLDKRALTITEAAARVFRDHAKNTPATRDTIMPVYRAASHRQDISYAALEASNG